MQNTTYVGVTRLRYVQCTHDKGRPYYYFRRRPFPIVRLPGEPGSELFMTVYNSALAATSHEKFTELRANMEQYRPRNVELSPLATAVMAWAEREPITLLQATTIAELFGVATEEIVRGREVVDQRLEPVAKSFEEDNEGGKAEEIGVRATPSEEDPALPLESEEALDEPASNVAA